MSDSGLREFENIKLGRFINRRYEDVMPGDVVLFVSTNEQSKAQITFCLPGCPEEFVKKCMHWNLKFDARFNVKYKNYQIVTKSLVFLQRTVNKALFVPDLMSNAEFDAELNNIISKRPDLKSIMDEWMPQNPIPTEILSCCNRLQTILLAIGYTKKSDPKLESQIEKLFWYCNDIQKAVIAMIHKRNPSDLMYECKLPFGVSPLTEEQARKLGISEDLIKIKAEYRQIKANMQKNGTWYLSPYQWDSLNTHEDIKRYLLDNDIFVQCMTPNHSQAICDTYLMREEGRIYDSVARLWHTPLSETIPTHLLAIMMKSDVLPAILSTDQLMLFFQIMTEGVTIVDAAAGTGKSLTLILATLFLSICFPQRRFYIPTVSGINCVQNMAKKVKEIFSDIRLTPLIDQLKAGEAQEPEEKTNKPGIMNEFIFSQMERILRFGSLDDVNEFMEENTCDWWLRLFEAASGSTNNEHTERLKAEIKRNRSKLENDDNEDGVEEQQRERRQQQQQPVKKKLRSESYNTTSKKGADLFSKLRAIHPDIVENTSKLEKIIQVSDNVYISTIASLVYNAFRDRLLGVCGGVIVDENTCSLTPEMSALIGLLKPLKIVVGGDRNQLGPITGVSFLRVFKEAFPNESASRCLVRNPNYTLTTNFRTDNMAMKRLFSDLNEQGIVCLRNEDQYEGCFVRKCTASDQEWETEVINVAKKMYHCQPNQEAPSSSESQKIIVSTHLIRERVEKLVFAVRYPRHRYGDLFPGVSVIIRKNNHDLFNGEEVVIKSVLEDRDNKLREVVVNFKEDDFNGRLVVLVMDDDRYFVLKNEDREFIEYETSTTRTRQGTEYDMVYFILPPLGSRGLTRQAIKEDVYVSSITRAKKCVYMLGPDTLDYDIMESAKSKRAFDDTETTILAMKLKHLFANNEPNRLYATLKSRNNTLYNPS